MIMKIHNILTISAVAALSLASCDDMFEPNIEQHPDFDQIIANPTSFYGLLMTPYSRFNDDRKFYTNRIHEDLATGDFYENTPDNWLQMSQGTWTSKNNQLDKWNDIRESIQYINIFLENMDKVVWSKDKEVNEKFKKRLSGEAYALRGIMNYFFLRDCAGFADGESQMLGIPLLTKSEDVNSNFNQPRATFRASIEQIMADLDEAAKYLPDEYSGTDLVLGEGRNGLINGTIVKAVKSQVALMAASPLYQGQSDITWKQAADYVAIVLQGHELVPDGNTWYAHSQEIEDLSAGALPPEAIWRGDRSGTDDVSFEKDCYPPSLYGSGLINPTQNLVDAFPMANGYPITESASGYDPKHPYDNRDPRLDLYIIHDGSIFKEKEIETFRGSTKQDGINDANGKATVTGYYLKKFMNEEVDPNSTKPNGRRHYNARIRYTELFLNYAEAQNEAEGPQSAGTLGKSPYEIIKAIRQRGGITNDQYLESIKSDQAKMRELIHNERRIELMGENFRFWDLRRWKEPLNEQPKMMNITVNGTNRTYSIEPIPGDNFHFEDYMYYCPLPETEVLKWTNLKQNSGW